MARGDLDAKAALEKYRQEIGRLRLLLRRGFSNGASSGLGTCNNVIFVLGISCKDMVEEILYLVKGGFGRAAVRTLRTMYECTVAARYVSLHPETATVLLNGHDVVFARILQSIPIEFRDTTMHANLVSRVPKYAAGKPVSVKDLKWSDASPQEMARESGAVFALHPFAWDQASAYVHPSPLYVLRLLTQQGSSESVIVREEQEYEIFFALRLAHDLALNILALRLKLAPDSSAQTQFDQCHSDFVAMWGYPPHI